MKLLLLVFLGLLAFVLTLAAALAATGNLSQERLSQVLGKAPEQPSAAGAAPGLGPPDESDRLAQQLKDAQEKLRLREAAVGEEE